MSASPEKVVYVYESMGKGDSYWSLRAFFLMDREAVSVNTRTLMLLVAMVDRQEVRFVTKGQAPDLEFRRVEHFAETIYPGCFFEEVPKGAEKAYPGEYRLISYQPWTHLWDEFSLTFLEAMAKGWEEGTTFTTGDHLEALGFFKKEIRRRFYGEDPFPNRYSREMNL